MQRYTFSVGEIPPLGYRTTLCLGTFDGFHKGHQALVLEARKKAQGDIAVLLFSDNPAKFFANGKAVQVLTSLEDKCRLFAANGVDIVYIVQVDAAFFDLSPEDFLRKVIKPLSPSLLVVGEDYSFGKLAAGRLPLLKQNFSVDVVPLLEEGGQKISTQAIIADIQAGELGKATAELGRPYQLVGTIKKGFQKGRTIGFPTANMALSADYVLPKNGVYLGLCYLRGIAYKSLINVGVNPTVGLLSAPVVECYLDGFDEEAYGETLYCEFLSHIRDEIKFKTLAEVGEQIHKDMRYLGK